MSERIRARDNLAIDASGKCTSEDHEDIDLIPKSGVRETNAALSPAPVHSTLASPSAHTSNRLIAQLNNNWRVVDDPLQWILQRRKGNPRKKNSGWRDRSFCTTREVLLRCVREYCGEVDQNALADLLALPDHHALEQPK
jgi:hypothetical protein